MAQTGYAFVPPHNPRNYPLTMGTAQEQALRTETFQQNQVLFRRFTYVEIALPKAYHHGGTISLPVPTGGPVYGFCTGDRATDAPAFIQLLRGDIRNRSQGKHYKNDGAI